MKDSRHGVSFKPIITYNFLIILPIFTLWGGIGMLLFAVKFLVLTEPQLWVYVSGVVLEILGIPFFFLYLYKKQKVKNVK